MATLRGKVWDKRTGRPLEARVHVLSALGRFCAPESVILKVGGGEPCFYCEGDFSVEVPRGQTDVVVERGIEYRPLRVVVDAPAKGVVEVDLPLERWIRLSDTGWYAGNTHIHYNETESRPLDRLRLDPRVEDLPVFIVSIVKRGNLPYASNSFPIGRHPFSTPEHVIDIGEESRHNDAPWNIGLGHIMLINIRQVVEPVSRGILVDESNPDYPPLIDACDEAHRQGGVVLWCHNAAGMEAPVAAVLGRLDALNLHDPAWIEPEYELWYKLLNCGIRLPASTGSDWFLSSSNRVYVDVGSNFSYAAWLEGLRAGRTFITDGPILRLTVAGYTPSNEVLAVNDMVSTVPVVVEWVSVQPVDRVEILRDGEVVAVEENVDQATRGRLAATLDVLGAGWIAARCYGRRRNSYGHAIWAHTSPVYLRAMPERSCVHAACSFFMERLELASQWLQTRARFDNTSQRDRMLELFAEGRRAFERLYR